MSGPFTLDPALLEGLDKYRAEQSGGAELDRNEAINVIVRDWLQGRASLLFRPSKRSAGSLSVVPT